MACLVGDTPQSNATAPVVSDLLKNSIKMEQIAGHLNRKNRESKFAQRDSTELFQTLYVLQKTRNSAVNDDDDTKEDVLSFVDTGVVCEIRENGFFVFLPRLGIKGPVYLKVGGEVTIPLSLLKRSGSGSLDEITNDDHLVEVSGCQMDTDKETHITVQVPSEALASYPSGELVRTVRFRLFDKVKVALRLQMSHAHRHSIYMTLIGLDQSASMADLGHSIRLFNSKEWAGQDKRDSAPTQSGSPIHERQQQDPWAIPVHDEQQQDPWASPIHDEQQQQGQQQQPKPKPKQQQKQRQQQDPSLARRGSSIHDDQQLQQQRGSKASKKYARRQSLTPEGPYQQTHADQSLYNLVESFDRLRIIESTQPSLH